MVETWVIILVVFIGLVSLTGLGVGLYFLFKPKTSGSGRRGGNDNGGGSGGDNSGNGRGNGGSGGGFIPLNPIGGGSGGGFTPLNPINHGGGGGGGDGGGNKCIIPVLNLAGVIGIPAGDQVVFRFILNPPNITPPPSSYMLELSSDNFASVSTTGVAGDTTSVKCNPSGCVIQVSGSSFSPAVFSTNYSARIRIVDKICGTGDPSNVVQVTGR